MSAINQRAGHYHSTDAERSDGLRGRATCPLLSLQTPRQHVDHSLEDSFKSLPGSDAAARNVGRQSHHRAGVLHTFIMLAGEIGADHLRADVRRGNINMDALPAVLPFRVGEETVEHFGVEIAFGVEITVEPAVGELRAGHDLADGDAFKAVPVEQAARAVNDAFSHLRTMAGGIGHGAPQMAAGAAAIFLRDPNNIMLNIFS